MSSSSEKNSCLDTSNNMVFLIKKPKLTAKNKKIYWNCKKKGQENKVHKMENQNTAHFEDSES